MLVWFNLMQIGLYQLNSFIGYEQLVFVQVQEDQERPSYFIAETGQAFTVPCKPHYPNVTVALFKGNPLINFSEVALMEILNFERVTKKIKFDQGMVIPKQFGVVV